MNKIGNFLSQITILSTLFAVISMVTLKMPKIQWGSTGKTGKAITLLICFALIVLLIQLMGISPLNVYYASSTQTLVASAFYTHPLSIYFGAQGLNTTFFQTPLFWIYRYITTGWTDGTLTQIALFIEMLARGGWIPTP